jgi:hypothetical protein
MDLRYFFDRLGAVMGQQWRRFQRDPAVGAIRRIVNQKEKIGGLSQIFQGNLKK